ncbi:hypothetical protein F4824DRAFT_485362 [Ustulina deusta]|nr:hypothetical protein F4824DRAFT_485362 [Ustulina deusta]
MASDTTYTVEPKAAHTHTVIFLHGRDSNCREFADELFEIQTLFPNIRWVFSSASILQLKRFSTDMLQWFDMWSTKNLAELLGVINKKESGLFEDTPKRFAGLIGLCSWMPVESHTKNYQRSEDTANIEILTRHAQHLHPVVIRSSRSTPVFLSHSVDDNVSLRLQVEWKEYENGGHWVNEPQGVDDIVHFMNRHMASDYSESPEE